MRERRKPESVGNRRKRPDGRRGTEVVLDLLREWGVESLFCVLFGTAFITIMVAGVVTEIVNTIF
jgi:hypothetical protein